MTVGELIAALQSAVAADPSTAELPALADGCDCWGVVGEVYVTDRWFERALVVGRVDNQGAVP